MKEEKYTTVEINSEYETIGETEIEDEGNIEIQLKTHSEFESGNIEIIKENETMDEGKMVIGWKKVNGFWYYFSDDGSMSVNSITPDGYLVGQDGKWIC